MSHKPYGPYERFIKRPQDFVCALLAILVLSPLLITLSIMVRIKLGSPVLFTQDRPGKDGKIFKLYKFRTMLPPKDGIIDPSQDALRLTAFGKKLRSTSLDELPELFYNYAACSQVLMIHLQKKFLFTLKKNLFMS